MTIELVPLCTATITLADPLVLPNTPSGTRIIIEVVDAVYVGERLSGKHKGVAAADWMTVGRRERERSTSGEPSTPTTARWCT